MPKITIAIPSYNRRDFLKQAIASVLAQTFQDFEIVIFDNASNYDVAALIGSFNDKRISLNALKQNIGGLNNMARAINYPFSSSYVMAFHDDDYLRPQALEIILQSFEKYPQAALAVSLMYFVKNGAKMNVFFNQTIRRPIRRFLAGSADFVRYILKYKNVCFSTIVYRTDKLIDFKSMLKFDIWLDRPFLVEISKKSDAIILEEKLVNYRIHTGQITQRSEDWGDSVRCEKELFNYYKSNLPQPLSFRDKRLFYSYTTNNLLLFPSAFVKNFQDYWGIIKAFRQEGLFYFRYINIRGVYYFYKAVKKIYFQ
jgi:glycosyltransferase involved in cell wall biosynthesis